MAEPGDPQAPDDPDPDDVVGFASPASLQGRAREPEPDPERDLFSASVAATIPVEPEPGPEPGPAPSAPPDPPAAATPVAAASIFELSPELPARPRRREPPAIPGGGMGLYAVYALILFAVPTLGVSAIIGLLAVTGRAGPEDPLSQSHFIYQQRTLWTAAVAVAVGLIFFLVPFGFGPAIMFFAALWVVARGAAGVWALKAGRPIADPRGWWI
ncbi:hypothetical protein [uncultured Brevundimonas sp.]|uniref:hypothetical protein n=1 Tax=uncultured Brevundimonas sp. TaxID=213418 RepID=UPI002625EEC3|nr:hypothetical protein [uncultured Brevundimonas sp.]